MCQKCVSDDAQNPEHLQAAELVIAMSHMLPNHTSEFDAVKKSLSHQLRVYSHSKSVPNQDGSNQYDDTSGGNLQDEWVYDVPVEDDGTIFHVDDVPPRGVRGNETSHIEDDMLHPDDEE